MDPAGILGIVLALGAIFGAMFIEGTDPMAILLPAPLLLVWVGTIAVGIAGHTIADVKGSFGAVPRALKAKVPDPSGTIDTLVRLAERARREGLLALEEEARGIDDEFLKSGLQQAIDGTDPEDMRRLLEDKVASRRTADRVAAKYFQDMGGYAPTIGIIGTVISLVHVLSNLSDPTTLGHSIAAAFVATLWGILSANVIWLPLAARIRRMSDLEVLLQEITIEGLLAVQSGVNPRLVGETLRSLLPPVGAGSLPAAKAEADDKMAEAA
jgi:chemotaxis protein MotA